MISDRVITFGKFELEEVFALFCDTSFRHRPKKIKIELNDSVFIVKDSIRYHVFKRSNVCASCGLIGKYFLLQMDPKSMGSSSERFDSNGRIKAHFNMYGETYGRPVLFTKDHIVPVCKYGRTHKRNLQTMCYYCNQRKGWTYIEENLLCDGAGI
jgi:hypothetical protein